jgi:hypothetical protein
MDKQAIFHASVSQALVLVACTAVYLAGENIQEAADRRVEYLEQHLDELKLQDQEKRNYQQVYSESLDRVELYQYVMSSNRIPILSTLSNLTSLNTHRIRLNSFSAIPPCMHLSGTAESKTDVDTLVDTLTRSTESDIELIERLEQFSESPHNFTLRFVINGQYRNCMSGNSHG